MIYAEGDMRMRYVFQKGLVKKFDLQIFKKITLTPTRIIQVGKIVQISNGATIKHLMLINALNKCHFRGNHDH